jgi:hypothetical protein
MNASKTKLLRATTSKVSALATIFALTFVSAATFAQDNSQRNKLTEDVVVSGTEYQPNLVQEDGSHLKVKKQLKSAKPQNTTANKGTLSAQTAKGPLSRESARIDDDIDFWIYDSYITLTADIDYDGYYSSFTLEFDVDTIYQSAPIYAVIYTSTSEEFTPFYTTNIYNIYGDNTQDAIIIENDLVTGFPSNEYEIMVVIYDADTEEVLAVSDGTNDADLAYLSLESENYEYVETVEVVVVEHGGALGLWLFAGLGFAAYRRFKA